MKITLAIGMTCWTATFDGAPPPWDMVTPLPLPYAPEARVGDVARHMHERFPQATIWYRNKSGRRVLCDFPIFDGRRDLSHRQF